MSMSTKDKQEAAAAGAIAVVAYRKAIRATFDDNAAVMLGDLLCDLRHFADANGLDWQDAMSYADRHYDVEA